MAGLAEELMQVEVKDLWSAELTWKKKKEKEVFILRNAALDLFQEMTSMTSHCLFGFLIDHQLYLVVAFQLHFFSREKENEERLTRAATGNLPALYSFLLPS